VRLARRLDAEALAGTQGASYTQRLARLESARWKQVLDVQRPYRWNLRRLDLGRTLDVGCGLGRNLVGLAPGSVGIDHNAGTVTVARSRGLRALTPDEFAASPLARAGAFDSLLLSHVLEHLPAPAAQELVASYLPYVRPAGSVVLICPQELGYARDGTHVRYVDFDALEQLAVEAGLEVTRRYSFPLPRAFGRVFPHNEFVVVARTAVDAGEWRPPSP
jgi:SAM-dependent methyltransferase